MCFRGLRPIVVAAESASKSVVTDLPFSESVKVGNMLYLSGQVGTLPGTDTLVKGGIEGETRQAMNNIKAILKPRATP
jgi:Putative translation initiation inhibitor, yjgF family